jgi:hypothetical protein
MEVTLSVIVVMSPWTDSCTTPNGTRDNSISNIVIAPPESHIVMVVLVVFMDTGTISSITRVSVLS